MASRLSTFLRELKRRKVTHVALLYLIVGIGVIEGAQLLFDAFGVPRLVWQIVTFLTVLGLPIALVLAWAYELRPEGKPAHAHSEPETALREDARRRTKVAPLESTPSIVVLPFENLSPDPENAFFADGLTEEIIADLSKVRALKVISRTSAMTFKGTAKTVPAIAAELNVEFVLEGSVRRDAESLRITAQLIEAASDAHLWAEKYSGTIEDVFDLQETLSRRIVKALEVTLSPEEDRRLAARPITDIQAHDIWMRARQHALTLTEDGVDRAKALVEQALDLEGQNALLHATMAWVLAVQWGQVEEGAEEALTQARQHANKAMELDSDLPRSLLSMAIVHLRENDLQEFVRLGQRVLEIERDSHTLVVLGLYLAYAGRTEVAYRYAQEAVSLDPLSWLTTHAAPHVDVYAGNAVQAFGTMRDMATRLAPDEPWSAFEVGYAALQAGRIEEARDWFRQSMEGGSFLYSRMGAAFFHLTGGDNTASVSSLESPGLTRIAERVGYTSYLIGSCYAKIGETEKAFEWLQIGVEKGFTNHRFMSEYDPLLLSLRNEPRFKALVQEARGREAALEV